jgi:hypothetical protein
MANDPLQDQQGSSLLGAVQQLAAGERSMDRACRSVVRCVPSLHYMVEDGTSTHAVVLSLLFVMVRWCVARHE